MNLAFRYPIIFWNTACLISDAGGAEEDEIDEEASEELKVEESYSNEMEEFTEDDEEESSYDEDEDCDGYPSEVIITKEGKKKKKTKTTNYGKIAEAIGKIKSAGVDVEGPDINRSTYTFSPDVEHNTIRYGLSGITRIGEDLVKEIMSSRPYVGWQDFTKKIKITKPQMINLIKAGAFDEFGDRYDIMHEYVMSISDVKQRVTLQNMKMLIDFNLLPDEYDLNKRVFMFTKYLKKMKLDDKYYGIDNIAFNFIDENFTIDMLEYCDDTETHFKLNQKKWENIYQQQMNPIRNYIKAHSVDLLNSINNRLIKDMWNKYCGGSVSKWEMDSVSFYSHEHELKSLYDENIYDNFDRLPQQPMIEKMITMQGKGVPIYKLARIAGTVLDRNKMKKTVTLLCNNTVVTVKIYGNTFAQFDKQISERGADGRKHVVDKSWFSRGSRLIITGIRQDNDFLAKKYSRTPYALIEKIIDIKDGYAVTLNERVEAD